jgi:serine/threonine protein kinase
VKIGDLGLARSKHTEVKIDRSPGWTVKPKVEKLTPYSFEGAYTAPELKKDEYNTKVDVYSAGAVLYFISRYPVQQDSSVLKSEVKAIQRGELEINKYVYHNDDEKLVALIQNLLQKKSAARFNAKTAKKYMFPEEADNSTHANASEFVSTSQARNSTDGNMPTPQTNCLTDDNKYIPTSQESSSTDGNQYMPTSQENYSPDSSEAPKTEFFARKEEDVYVRRCFLNEFTFSALKAEVERCTRVNASRQMLLYEQTINEKERLVIIEDDKGVEYAFKNAAEKDLYVVLVVTEKEEDSITMKLDKVVLKT